MERFRCLPGAISISVEFLRYDDEVTQILDVEGYKIFDSTFGHHDDKYVAFSRDVDLAHRITRLLNADQAMLERQGVKG